MFPQPAEALRVVDPDQIIETDEFSNPDYLRNAPNRCYFCKTVLYTRLEALSPTLAIDVLVNGANLDDQGDYRPGMQAAGEHRVRSPLAGPSVPNSPVNPDSAEKVRPDFNTPLASATVCSTTRITTRSFNCRAL